MIKYKVILKKDSWLMRAIGFILKPFNKEFMSNYVTTIGSTMYSPRPDLDDGIIQHELQHISDSKKWPVLYELSYLFCLPFGWTMRAHWERRAYRHSIKALILGGYTKEMIVSWLEPNFTGPNYLWMDLRKKKVRAWILDEIENVQQGRAVETIEAERIS